MIYFFMLTDFIFCGVFLGRGGGAGLMRKWRHCKIWFQIPARYIKLSWFDYSVLWLSYLIEIKEFIHNMDWIIWFLCMSRQIRLQCWMKLLSISSCSSSKYRFVYAKSYLVLSYLLEDFKALLNIKVWWRLVCLFCYLLTPPHGNETHAWV